MKPTEMLQQLYVLVLSGLQPQQHVIHKPNRGGTGQALKLDLRLNPKWIETADDRGYFDRDANKEGGLFLELVGQSGIVDGNATFDWKNPIRAKLGIADLTALLVGIREWRRGGEVPVAYRGKEAQPNVVTLFHKTPGGGSTIITLTLDDQNSILRISKGKDLARSISLGLAEELLFERYLSMGLDSYLRVGKR